MGISEKMAFFENGKKCPKNVAFARISGVQKMEKLVRSGAKIHRKWRENRVEMKWKWKMFLNTRKFLL